jgi:predicted nucleic acid-binding protein
MILVDTSVWVDHFRQSDARLAALLNDNSVAVHVWVIGELACGNLSNRNQLLELLQGLPRAPLIYEAEILQFIERHGLMGRGIGYIDVQLLAAAKLAGYQLWTRDKRLHQLAEKLDLINAPDIH